MSADSAPLVLSPPPRLSSLSPAAASLAASFSPFSPPSSSHTSSSSHRTSSQALLSATSTSTSSSSSPAQRRVPAQSPHDVRIIKLADDGDGDNNNTSTTPPSPPSKDTKPSKPLVRVVSTDDNNNRSSNDDDGHGDGHGDGDDSPHAAGPPPPSPPASEGHPDLPSSTHSKPDRPVSAALTDSPIALDDAPIPNLPSSSTQPSSSAHQPSLHPLPPSSLVPKPRSSSLRHLSADQVPSPAVTFDLPWASAPRTSQSSHASSSGAAPIPSSAPLPGPSPLLARAHSDGARALARSDADLSSALTPDQARTSRAPARWNTTTITPRARSHSLLLADDIEQQAEQVRRERERHSKRRAAEADAQAERGALVGNVIAEGHANYVLMYNMLTGIRIAVSRYQAKIKRALTPEDFTARHKYSFDIVGNELTPSAKYDFKFKDYAPWVFRELREDYFRLDPADYLLSLTAKYILSELGSPGKSGSFFYFSRDYRFIIKTIHRAEHQFLRAVLPRYHAHVRANPHTLLSRFYGLHRVKLPRGRKIHFVIMNNLFPAHKDVHETYDLKGSTVGRLYPEEKAQNPRAVLKDLNWIRRGKSLELGPEKRALLTEQLRRDAEFLQELGVMDYSLLIGIHHLRRGNRDNVRRNTLKVFSPDVPAAALHRTPTALAVRRAMRASDLQRLELGADLPEEDTGDRADVLFYQDEGGLRATDERNAPLDTVYYLGVIDILTPYTVKKRVEHFWKGLKADRHKISPVPPEEYAARFFAFMKAVMRGGGGGASFITPTDLRTIPGATTAATGAETDVDAPVATATAWVPASSTLLSASSVEKEKPLPNAPMSPMGEKSPLSMDKSPLSTDKTWVVDGVGYADGAPPELLEKMALTAPLERPSAPLEKAVSSPARMSMPLPARPDANGAATVDTAPRLGMPGSRWSVPVGAGSPVPPAVLVGPS